MVLPILAAAAFPLDLLGLVGGEGGPGLGLGGPGSGCGGLALGIELAVELEGRVGKRAGIGSKVVPVIPVA